MKLLKVMILALAVAAPGLARAQQIVATDVLSIANFFLNAGTKPKIDIDDYGDPRINVRYQGAEFAIYYYGCNNGQNCSSVQFYSGYKTEGSVSYAQINKWNADKRFVKAYLSDSGNARIEQDIYLGDYGMDAGDFGNIVDNWVRSMARFEVAINW